MRPLAVAVSVMFFPALLSAQTNSSSAHEPVRRVTPSVLPLQEASRAGIASEIGGAYMSGSRCDADGNLYLRKLATDRPLLGSVVKIDPDGKRVASFDPTAFSQLHVERADVFAPAADGGLYQIASTDGTKPQVYVLRFSPDGLPASAIRLDADFEPYQLAAFPNDNLLVSGSQRDADKPGTMRPFTAVFSGDGRLLAKISFEPAAGKPAARPAGSATRHGEERAPTLDLSEADAGVDGNVYALRQARSGRGVVDVISPAGTIARTLTIPAPTRDLDATGFRVSGNRVAVAFEPASDLADDRRRQVFVVADAQTGRRIGSYSYAGEVSASFVCYSANEGMFTFLNLADGNKIEVIQAAAR